MAKDLTLYQIEDQLAQLISFREDARTDEEQEAADVEIKKYVAAEIKKVDGIRAYIRYCEMMRNEAKEEAARQSERAEAWGNRLERLKNTCLYVLGALDKRRVDGSTGSLRICANGGQQPVKITEESLIPDEFKVVTLKMSLKVWRELPPPSSPVMLMSVAVNIAGVGERLRAGEAVPGAHLEHRGEHLRVD